ncbi:PilZ domain-containing protein [Bradyrhizobium sp. 76]|uniref:PilZ domain-containing protein n=1 Tax=Bradyrhizobium sp. 76 TaxID=2782680 RepID=UPI001FFB4BFC|nr:PilZ domain-containing protein [Bradyrhizobium sp. 76]MCK1409379.1 PilZ domain-containing protein [Bradyrhizobium sp. 76]
MVFPQAMERRIPKRQRVFKAGRLTLSGITVDCTVRNLSSAGALIELPAPEGVPHELMLSLPTHRLNFNCCVVWRDNKRLGVVFGPSAIQASTSALLDER